MDLRLRVVSMAVPAGSSTGRRVASPRTAEGIAEVPKVRQGWSSIKLFRVRLECNICRCLGPQLSTDLLLIIVSRWRHAACLHGVIYSWATPPCTCWIGSSARPWLPVGWTAERDGSLLVFGAADHWHGSLMLLHLTGYMWCRER